MILQSISLEYAKAASPEDLAGVVLKHLVENHKTGQPINRGNFAMEVDRIYGRDAGVTEVFLSAWTLLERGSYIVEKGNGWSLITKAGLAAAAQDKVSLPPPLPGLDKSLLHPSLQADIWSDFLRGKRGDSVFKAFRKVEVRVRKAGGFAKDDVGVKMMREAFSPKTGPLTDRSAPSGEQTGRMELFAGAFGSYKNEQSHHEVELELQRGMELLVIASHLLSILDERDEAVDKPA